MSKICAILRYFRKSLAFSFACTLLCLLCSCGYSTGSIMHPQIRSIAIADVKNETMEVQAAALLRGILAERFQFDNSLKVTTPDKADCIVYAQIVSVSTVNISWNSDETDQVFRPSMFRLTAKVKYTVRVPGQARDLVPSGELSANSTYQYTHDPSLGKRNGLRQAFLLISDRIVNAVTEGW